MTIDGGQSQRYTQPPIRMFCDTYAVKQVLLKAVSGRDAGKDIMINLHEINHSDRGGEVRARTLVLGPFAFASIPSYGDKCIVRQTETPMPVSLSGRNLVASHCRNTYTASKATFISWWVEGGT